MRAALVDVATDVVANVVELHDAWPEPDEAHHRWDPPPGMEVVILAEDAAVGPGFQYDRDGRRFHAASAPPE